MRTWAWWALLAVPLAACSTDASDFEHSAEHYIESDAMAAQAGTTFTAASCERPVSTRPGTTFTCTATDAAGHGVGVRRGDRGRQQLRDHRPRSLTQHADGPAPKGGPDQQRGALQTLAVSSRTR